MSWMKANCQSLGYTVYDTKRYDYCSPPIEGVYTCGFPSESSYKSYKGKVKDGELHGAGILVEKSGHVYRGEFKDGEKWCGVEQKGNDFWTYKNGKVTYGKAGVDWGTVAAGVLIAGAVYAAADAASESGSGSSGYSSGNSSGYSSGNYSPSKCSYTLNNKTIKIDNPYYSWGSCPSSYSYEEPLMCNSTYSYASPKCDIGKACGNTCISSYDTCHVGRGSACNLNYRSYP